MSPGTHTVECGEAECAAPAGEPRRLLLVGSHFVQYASPVFRQMVSDGRIDLTVAYCSMQGSHASVDPEFGVEVAWDASVSEGYPWVYVPNRAPRPGLGRFFGLINPGLWKLIRDGKFDAMFVSGYFYASAWIAIAAAKWHGVPILFTTEAHTLGSFRNWSVQSNWRLRLKKFYVRRILSLGKVLLTMSSGSFQQLVGLGFPEDRIVLSPYTVDNDWWTAQASKADGDAARSAWKIPPNATVALFCGKLQPWKGPMDLLEAFAQANVPDSYLVFAGDGPLRNELERRADDLKLGDRVRFLGFTNQSQLPAIYCAADVLVLPSHYEGFGLVVNEAMVSGCPVVVSDRVGAKYDLVRDGENGYVFPTGDIPALAAILRDILLDSEKRVRMGRASIERMKTWSPQQYVDAVVKGVELAARDRS